MAPELAAARAVSRRCWARRASTRAALPPWFVGRTRRVRRAPRDACRSSKRENLPPGYAFLEQRYFGGFVPRFVRIRLLTETDGEPLPAYRVEPGVGMSGSRRARPTLRSLAGKTVLALGTLERWVGRPVFDQVLAEFVRDARVRDPPTLADFCADGERASADRTCRGSSTRRSDRLAIFDYGVERLTSEPDADGAFETTVVIARRFGDARFTGCERRADRRRSRADAASRCGSHSRTVSSATDFWDGRDREKTFRYRSPSEPSRRSVDPDRTLLLDVQQTNNSLTLGPQSRRAASRWAVLWLAWLRARAAHLRRAGVTTSRQARRSRRSPARR